MSFLIAIVSVLAACAVGVPLAYWATAPIRRNRKSFAVASALFLSFGLYNPSAEKLVEAAEDSEHAKRQKGAGDPPEPD